MKTSRLRRRHRRLGAAAATVCASNLLGIGLGAYYFRPAAVIPQAFAAVDSPAPKPDSTVVMKTAENFRAVAKMVGPSVLTIKASATTPKQRVFRQRGSGMSDPLADMLRQFGFQNGLPASPQPQEASGSGFIIDKRGYVVTNYHVVKGAGKISVLLPEDESEEIEASVVGTDPKTDIAVLKIKTSRPLQAIEWADSNAAEVGDPAIAIGSPFMLTHSMTAGIVSAKGRSASALMGSEFGYELIQTDAAINPGNSGGPLCGADGKVIGVNTAIYSNNGGSLGIGFAIPSNLARQVAQTLIEKGKIERGWIGVAIQQAGKEMAKELGLTASVVVHSVQEKSPAEKAGLRPGDVIVQVGSKKIVRVDEVQTLIAGLAPGAQVDLEVVNYEDQKTRTVHLKVGKLASEPEERTTES